MEVTKSTSTRVFLGGAGPVLCVMAAAWVGQLGGRSKRLGGYTLSSCGTAGTAWAASVTSIGKGKAEATCR
jgi:hypothetical protein